MLISTSCSPQGRLLRMIQRKRLPSLTSITDAGSNMEIETAEVTLARIDERTKHMVESFDAFKVHVKEHLDYQDEKIEALPSWRTFSVALGGILVTTAGWAVMYFIHK
jgi:hypothetical protein